MEQIVYKLPNKKSIKNLQQRKRKHKPNITSTRRASDDLEKLTFKSAGFLKMFFVSSIADSILLPAAPSVVLENEKEDGFLVLALVRYPSILVPCLKTVTTAPRHLEYIRNFAKR